MKINFFNTLHLSSFPILISIFVRVLFFILLLCLKFKYNLMYFLLYMFLFVFFIWLKDIFLEGVIGMHTSFMIRRIKVVFYFFLLRELMLFFSMFWFLFDRVLVPIRDLGEIWVPIGLEVVDPIGIPFLNSLILLRSAVTLTWSHYNFLLNKETKVSFLITLFLGLVFLIIQLSEYIINSFSIRDSVYGSIFFMITGFHGAHVFLGLLFLNLNYLRLKKGYFRVNHHLSFEFSIIYWHFVDVIWLFLYVFLYWWSL